MAKASTLSATKRNSVAPMLTEPRFDFWQYFRIPMAQPCRPMELASALGRCLIPIRIRPGSGRCARTGPTRMLFLPGRAMCSAGLWSLDGKVFFFTAFDGDRNNLWALADEPPRSGRNPSPPQQLTFGPTSYGRPIISPDGKQLFAIGEQHQGELSVYDRKSEKFVPYLGGISVCFVDFSRDGQWMAYVSYPEGALWRSKIDGSEKRQLTRPPRPWSIHAGLPTES